MVPMGDASDKKLTIRNFQIRKSRTQGEAFEPKQQQLAPETYGCTFVTYCGLNDIWRSRRTKPISGQFTQQRPGVAL